MTIFSCCKSNGLHLVLLEVVQGQIYIYIHLYIYSRFVLEGLTLQKTRLKLVILSNIFPHRYLQKESLFLSLKCKMFTFCVFAMVSALIKLQLLLFVQDQVASTDVTPQQQKTADVTMKAAEESEFYLRR